MSAAARPWALRAEEDGRPRRVEDELRAEQAEREPHATIALEALARDEPGRCRHGDVENAPDRSEDAGRADCHEGRSSVS